MAGLDAHVEEGTARAAAVCAVAAVRPAAVAEGERTELALVLAVQGLCTLAWAWRHRRPCRGPGGAGRRASRIAWRVGAAQLVLAAWVGAASAGLAAVEWYSLSAAAGLLIAAAPDCVRDGPGRRGGRHCWSPPSPRRCWR